MKSPLARGAKWVGLIICVLLGTLLSAAELTPAQIVASTLSSNHLMLQQTVTSMTLETVKKSGRKRTCDVEVRSIKVDGLKRSLVRFDSPPDLAGTRILSVELADGSKQRYLYLPAIGKAKRLGGKQHSQRFMDTDFTYADMESRDLETALLKRLPDETLLGRPTYVLDATPSDPASSEYSKTISWIDQASFIRLKVEFFDPQQKLLKTLTVERLEQKGDRWMATDTWLRNVQEGSSTHLLIKSIQFDVPLSAEEFTPEALSTR